MEHIELPEHTEIADTSDFATLMHWHEEAAELFDNIKAQLHAYTLTGNITDDDEDWAIRARSKVGYAGATLRRIERRIVALGGDLPLTVDREERELIGKLKHRVRLLEYLLRSNGISEEQEG